MKIRRALVLILTALPCAGGLGAQESEPQPELPPEVAERVVEFYNRAGTARFTGEARIAEGSELVGDVAVLGGPLLLAGRVRGSVVVINGVLRLQPGGEVTGDVIVVGGALRGLGSARIGGTFEVYAEPLHLRHEGDRIAVTSPALPRGVSAGREFRFGRADMTVFVPRSYNRVEGLPIAAGPRLRFGHSNPTRVEALLQYRTAAGLSVDDDELGYVLRVDQSVGGRDALRVGVTLRREVTPIEAWGISDRENSLSTFLLHRDYRDHYLRQGWDAHARLAPAGRGWDAALSFAHERHGSLPTAGPWSLSRNDEEWRPQPLVAEGTLHSLALRGGVDNRNDPLDPATGWFARAELEKGLGGSLENRALPRDDGDFTLQRRRANDRFFAGSIDLRRYERVGPTSRLALRVVGAGSLDGEALPAQRQRALGGEGSLPAYSPFAVDCGARETALAVGEERFHPYYGCDHLILVQLEYRAGFPFVDELTRRAGLDLRLSPEWVAFFDTGRAWTDVAARQGRGGGQDDFAADAGLGLRLGRVGLYWAHSLSGQGQGTNFFVRLGSRF